MPRRSSGEDVVIIKKYANRRLYDTESSSYITLDRLAEMVRQKRDFKVIDAKSGEDITHNVLTQIIMEEEAGGESMLPVNFLRQLIGMYGGSMQAMVPQYLETSLETLQRNQAHLQDVMTGAFAGAPFADLARRNMEMFTAARSGITGKTEKEDLRAEVRALKTQVTELQKKLDQRGG
jgi:polyhydroxyalkanoate synthesis repressor PhaR